MSRPADRYRASVVKPGPRDGGAWAIVVRPPHGAVDELGRPVKPTRRSSRTTDRALAEKRAAEVESKLNATLLAIDPTLAEVVQWYLDGRNDLRETTRANTRSAIRSVRDLLADVRASELSRSAVLLAQDELARRGFKPRSVNGYMKQLRAAWRWARERWPDAMPRDWPTVRGLKAKKITKRAYTDEELSTLLAWAATYQRGKWLPVLSVAADTGMRIREVCSLRWEDVDLEAGQVRVREGKTDEGTWVGCPRATLAMLGAPRARGPWVFPGRSTAGHATRCGVYAALRVGLDAVLPGRFGVVDLHSLRRYNAWALVEEGVPLGTAQRQMRHASADLTLYYQAGAVGRDLLGAVERVRARRDRAPHPGSLTGAPLSRESRSESTPAPASAGAPGGYCFSW